MVVIGDDVSTGTSDDTEEVAVGDVGTVVEFAPHEKSKKSGKRKIIFFIKKNKELRWSDEMINSLENISIFFLLPNFCIF